MTPEWPQDDLELIISRLISHLVRVSTLFLEMPIFDRDFNAKNERV